MPTPTKALTHTKVRDLLLSNIRNGAWPPDHLLPGEIDLAREMEVSVGTVRRALQDLVDSRLLQRTRKKGTTVTAHTQELMRDCYFHVVRRADHDKAYPHHRVLRFASGRPAGLPPGLFAGDETIHRVESLAELHGDAVLYDIIFVPASVAPDLTREVFSNRSSSAFALYQMRYGATVIRAEETVAAMAASPKLARVLDVAVGTPLLEISRTAFGFDERVIEFRRRCLKTDKHVYLNRSGSSL